MHAFLLIPFKRFNQIISNFRAISIYLPIYFSFHFRLYVLCVICLIGGVPRMGPRVPFALLPLGIYLSNKVFK